MKTLIRDAYWDILEVFYRNNNTPTHLREISRTIQLNESPLTRHLKALESGHILDAVVDGNLKKFCINKAYLPEIFPMFDAERMRRLPSIRRNAIAYYVNKMQKKPVFMILFGSTAKGSFRQDSDMDVLEIFNEKTDTRDACKYAEAQTGIHISAMQMQFKDFIKELKLKEDHVVQSALETGFPVYNQKYFYEAINNE